MAEHITSLERTIERDQALMIVNQQSRDFSPQVQKILYYPYLWIHYEYDVKTILGKRTIRAYVMVDLINNQAHTADNFGTVDIDVEKDNILSTDVIEEQAFATASTYLLHSSIHVMKALLCPEKRVIEHQNIYKPFWIVRCVNAKNETFKVMVDAMTGHYQIIN